MYKIGTEAAYKSIDRKGMYNFLMGLRHAEHTGSFIMHEKGEEDLRGVYIAVVIADILNISDDKLMDGVADYIASCQTYEGGSYYFFIIK